MDLFTDFSRVLLSILFEALPFVLIGSLLSGLMEVFVPAEALGRIMPRNRLLAALFGASAGVVLPMCECGIVPVLRRLIRKGVPVHAAIAYLLAAPIVNPVVILSTLAAFRMADPALMTGLRVGIGAIVAVGTGLLASALIGREGFKVAVQEGTTHRPPFRAALPEALRHAGRDFIEIGAFLVLGASIAAVLNVIVSRSVIDRFATNHVTATVAMMGLAALLNLCSEADAFVAWSFRGFSLAARLAFLVLGPMFDLKLLVMYTRVFRGRMIALVCVSVIVLVFVAIMVVGYAIPTLADPAYSGIVRAAGGTP